MRILKLLTNPFVYDSRVYNEAKSLIDVGYQVSLIAWDRNGQFKEYENKDGIEVFRVKNNRLMRLVRKKPLQLFIFWQLAYRQAFSQNFDIIHCHDLDTLQVGIKLKKALNRSLVYDAHEIYPYLLERDLTRIFKTYFQRIERIGANWVNQLLVADENYENYFRKIGYRRILPILNTKRIISTTYHPPQNKIFTLVYIGTLSRSRFLIELVEIVGHLEQVKLILAGLGPIGPLLEQKCKSYHNINFMGVVPDKEVIPLTQKANAVVCMINPKDKNNQIASANKQFEAMVAGRPIIATERTRVGEITEQERCGLVINFSKAALEAAIIKLRDNPQLCEQLGRNALRAALNKYNWEKESKKLLTIYASLSK